jgi:PAS domain S-box-containing protein
VALRKKEQLAQQVVFTVSKILSGDHNFDEALSLVLQAMCEQMSWDASSFWQLDHDRNLLYCNYFYSSKPCPNFAAMTLQLTLGKGRGFPGSVWQENHPMWIADVIESDNFPRAATANEDGLHAAFAFPVHVGHTFVGVFEFFSNKIAQPDIELLSAFALVGAALGQFLERHRYERELTEQIKLNLYVAEIGSAVNKLDTLPAIMVNCAEITRRQLDLTQTFICAYAAGAKGLTVATESDHDNIQKADASLLAALNFESVMQQQVPYVANDLENADLLDDPKRLNDADITAFAVYPFILDDKPLGAMITFASSRLQKTTIEACARAADYLGQCIARKTSEQRLIESEGRFRIFADNVDECLFISAPQLTEHFYISPAFEKIWGIPLSSVYADPSIWLKSIVPEHVERVKDFVSRLKGYELPDPNLEYQILKADGSRIWLSVKIFAVVDQENGSYHICGSVTDITERKIAEKRVNDFYLTVSHELRTPLTSIKGALILLERRHSDSMTSKAKELAQLASKECDRLIRLISDMLDFKKIEAGMLQLVKESFNAAEMVTQTEVMLAALAAEKNIELAEDIQISAQIVADRDRIIQVLTNLISNAIKFSPSGTKIVVRVERLDTLVRFSVIDSGCGIDEQDQSKLFQVFQQLASDNKLGAGGTGLGLAICKGIVTEHGGEIGVISAPGKGSTFWFSLPQSF